MIEIPTAPWAHYVGDAVAWAAAAVAARWQHRKWPGGTARLARQTAPGYFLSLALGADAGAWLFGSLNSLRALAAAPSHSIAGALAGGILAVELWKLRHGVRQSTGTVFVLPLCVGIVIGRFGCLLSGLPDNTYGTPADLPWAVNLGDGVGRHPVQIYEAAAIAAFLLVFLHARLRDRAWSTGPAFHIFIMVYAAQRFLWEFLKPYPPLFGGLNIFHLLMGGLLVYGVIWWRSRHGDAVASRA
jgi:hypothetical protein